MRAIAFVDYDNIRLLPDRTPSDVNNNLDEILDRISEIASSCTFSIDEIDVRLYGGWICEEGTYSRIGEWALYSAYELRGRRMGVRLKPVLVTGAAIKPTEIFIGTVRLRSLPIRQKMVDSLLIVDILFFSKEPDCIFFIISDDDDFVPCALEVGLSRQEPCILFRLRPPGVGLNDMILERNGVKIDILRQ